MAYRVLDNLLDAVSLERHLVPFLNLTGWESVDPENPYWSVWYGPSDADGRALELVFPLDSNIGERREYCAKAIGLLAALHEEAEEQLAQRVLNYDRDLLFLRNLDTGREAALPFDRVVNQLVELEHVLLYAANAERDPRPYFTHVPNNVRRIMRDFSFGHTLPGSLAFAVGAPRLNVRPVQLAFVTQSHEVERDEEDTALLQRLSRPFARRLSERVARGLVSTRDAVQEHDHRHLLESYGSGFNSKMCTAVVKIEAKGDANVEFQIAWSPKVAPSQDVARLAPIRVTRDNCYNLEYVAEQLRKAKPEPITVVGNIRGLLVTDNPEHPTSRRAVILQGINPRSRRSARFFVELPKDDYKKAIEAHRRWERVAITGIPLRSADGWRLAEPQAFKIVG